MLWSVQWCADPIGFQCVVCNRCRVVNVFEFESLAGETDAEILQKAAARAVEMALEYRVPLDCVIQVRQRYVR